MIAVVLALGSAISYGVSDFVGGITAGRVSPWAVAFGAQITGCAIVMGVALTDPLSLSAASAAWAVVAGVGNGLGTVFLYRGLSSGRMGVVAPLSGVFAAIVPVILAVGLGERPSPVVWAGILAAAPAIWLVASSPSVVEPSRSAGSASVDGIAAGVGFGLTFAGVSQMDAADGLLPMALNQAIAATVIVAVSQFSGTRWLPRPRELAAPLTCGTLGAIGLIMFMAATQQGMLTVTAVIASLYPAATIVLAAALLHERIHRAQALGLALCVAAVALVATG